VRIRRLKPHRITALLTIFTMQKRRAFIGILALAALATFLVAAETVTPSRADAAPRSRPSAHPTFARDIARILYQNCASCHHSASLQSGAICGINAFPLLSYQDVKQHAREIAKVTTNRSMPPWLPEPGYGDFIGEHRLSGAQIQIIAEWVRDGAPEGSASEIPAAPEFTDDWQLGKPDMILEGPKPFSVPASGPDVFWNFIFSPSLKTARYVRAIEVRPGSNLSVIHHANVVLDRNHSARRLEREPGAGFPGMDVSIEHSPFEIPSHFLFWKPGDSPWVEPDGLAWRLDPGTDLVLNAHFMPSGTSEQEQPSIGLYFTDKPPDRIPMLIELENDDALDIPAGDHDFPVSDDFRLPRDVDVLAIYPHAHYLGHMIEGYATLPNGQRKWLVRIRDWDPNWQAVYHFAKPVFLPKGTIVSMRYHYDNSSANPRNPHSPPRRVRGGNQSTDEMAHLWLQVLPRGGGAQARTEIESALLQHRVEKYGNDFDARLSLGTMMLAGLNPRGAVDVLQQAVALDPKQEEARRSLGMAFDAIGRSPEALAEFRLAVQLKPDDEEARYSLARALVKSAKFAEALENFQKVAAAAPRDTNLRDDFGELLLRHGRAAEALEQFNAALAVDPSQATALHDRDVALDQLHQH